MDPEFHFSLFGKPILRTVVQTAGSQTTPVPWTSSVYFSDEPKDTVEAQRRRRGSGGGPGERADMPGRPSRKDRDSGGGFPSGGGYTSGGGGIPGGSKKLPIGMVILLIIGYMIFNMVFGGGDTSQPGVEQNIQQEYVLEETAIPEEAVIPEEEVVPAESPTPRKATAAVKTPVAKPASGGKGADQTWTVMLYQDADDPVLEQDIYMDLNEAERVGSSKQVNIVAQIDRYTGAYQGDGDWTTTRRYYLTSDDDLFSLNSEMVKDLGEVSMADPKTLVDFATWAIKTYPANKYVLILSDHGMGWPGGLTDPKPSTRRKVNNAFAQAINDNMMFTSDFDQALEEVRQQTGIDRFELVGLDACLMSHMEVYSALAPHTRYVVNSQEVEPALGWAYSSFLRALEDNPGMDGAELGRQIVASYIKKDERIVDDRARRDFLRQTSPMSGLFGGPSDIDPTQLSRQFEKSITLSAADMDALPGLVDALNQLAFALQKDKQFMVARARTYAQSYTSIFGKEVQPSYIDLGNFAQLLIKESSSAAVRSAAESVIEQVNKVVVAERHGSQKAGSTGISIYFPNSQLYQNSMAGARAYTGVATRFAQETLWDDFLAFHYTERPFELETSNIVAPEKSSRVAAPGDGQIEVSQLKLSAQTTDYDQPVTMEANLNGRNIGYVYLFVGYYDTASRSILVADKDYLESPETRQVGELYYPNWSDDQSFKLKFAWTPSVFAISDGSQKVVALLNPERYGASAEEAVYSADGLYTDAASGQIRYARLYFSDGMLRQVYGFSGTEPTGAVHEIIPQTGDQVTLIQTWLEPDGSGGYRQVSENGETLTFGNQMFSWEELYAAAGDYVVGFVVSDLEGNEVQTFGKVTIR